MDSMYVIGYRIDVTIPKELDGEDIFEEGIAAGLSVDGFPGEEWMEWPSCEGHNIISVWEMKGPFKVDYRCPIDRNELYEEMHDRPFDVPETYAADVLNMQETPMYKWLVQKLGQTNVKVCWGLALMVG